MQRGEFTLIHISGGFSSGLVASVIWSLWEGSTSWREQRQQDSSRGGQEAEMEEEIGVSQIPFKSTLPVT